MNIQASTRGQVQSIAEIISAHARKLVAQGRDDLIYMNVGQPSTGAPEQALAALDNYAKNDILGYTPVAGLPVLKNRIAKMYQDTHQLEINPNRIFITFGASGAFILTFLALFDAGQKIALPLPCYPAYLNTMKLMGSEPVLLPTQLAHNYQPTVEDLEALDTDIDCLVITSPGNPTGSMMPPEQLETLIAYCQRKNILLISDEIYHGIVFNSSIQMVSALQYSDDLLVMNSFSKYYSIPGWRCGWVVLPEPVVGNFASVARNLYVSPNAPSQIVAAACLDSLDELNTHVDRYAENRAILMREMPKAGFVDAPAPDGAFYYYARVAGLQEDSVDFCLRMLDEVGIAASPGTDFDPIHGRDHVRFSYAGSTAQMQEAVDRLKRWRG